MPIRELVPDGIRFGVPRPLTRAPEHGSNAHEQLARTERFREVVVGADLEAHDAIDLVAERGQHDDGHIRCRAQLAANFEPALARQHEIQHDEIEAAMHERAPSLLSVGDRRCREAVLLEKIAQQRADLAVVVYDEDVGRSVHGVNVVKLPNSIGREAFGITGELYGAA